MAAKQITWRKGLRWNKLKQGWVSVATGRVFTKTGLTRRKTMARRGTLKVAPKPKPKPKKRKPEVKPERKPKRTKKEVAYDRMRVELVKIAKQLEGEGYITDSRIHKNKDGTIDGEVRIRPKRGQLVDDIFLDMELASKPVSNTWVSTGIRYKPREDEEFYVKFQGLSQAGTYYQQNTKKNLPANFTTISVINEHMQARGRRKPEQVYLRLHWNKEDKQPEENK